ncbi:MAG TPA: response regulator [Acidobacteriota bacterium]
MTKIRVCVITRDEFRYAGILDTLSKSDDLLVLGKTDGQDEVGIVSHFRPDVIIFDLTTVPIELTTFVKACRQISHHTKVLVVGTDSDDAAALSALRAGATGYLNIVCSPLEIVDAIKAVHNEHVNVDGTRPNCLTDLELNHFGQHRHDAFQRVASWYT